MRQLLAESKAKFCRIVLSTNIKGVEMNIGTIGGIQSTFQSQGVSSNQRVDRDGDNDGNGVSGINGGKHHHGGGAFTQDVMQALQSIGLSFPSQTVNPASQASAANTDQNSTSTSAIDPRQALHQLMHDLRQALQQGGSQQLTNTPNTTTTGSDGDNDGSGSTSAIQNGYSNFSTNLQSLINTLGGNSATTGNGVTDKLQADFSNLVQALNNSNTSSTGATSSNTPTLQNFLTKLKDNLPNFGSNPTASTETFQAIA